MAVLVDTNVVVYAHDPGEPTKQARAIQVLDHLQRAGEGRLSVQCLAEFFVIVTRSRKPLLRTSDAASQVDLLVRSWPVFEITPLIVTEALRGVREHRLPYWDAQIWATARLNQAPVVFSEDFSPGAVLDGVRFVNPLGEDFRIEAWT